jgi:hypothetical protein
MAHMVEQANRGISGMLDHPVRWGLAHPVVASLIFAGPFGAVALFALVAGGATSAYLVFVGMCLPVAFAAYFGLRPAGALRRLLIALPAAVVLAVIAVATGRGVGGAISGLSFVVIPVVIGWPMSLLHLWIAGRPHAWSTVGEQAFLPTPA